MKVHALQHARQPRRVDAEATRRRRIARDEHEARRAIVEVVKRLLIGARGVRMVHALV